MSRVCSQARSPLLGECRNDINPCSVIRRPGRPAIRWMDDMKTGLRQCDVNMKWRWAEYVVRLDHHYWELAEMLCNPYSGIRRPGRPTIRWMDDMKTSVWQYDVNMKESSSSSSSSSFNGDSSCFNEGLSCSFFFSDGMEVILMAVYCPLRL